MSLNDKIRHHRIAAQHCREKAGPMWSEHGRLAPEEMSDKWREWRERADRHGAEVKRLLESTGRWDQRA